MNGWIPYLRVVFAVMALSAFAFAALWGNPNRHQDPHMAWHIESWTLVAGTEAVVLELALDYVRIPALVYVAIFTAGAAVSVWRLVLYLLTLRDRGWRGSSHDDHP